MGLTRHNPPAEKQLKEGNLETHLQEVQQSCNNVKIAGQVVFVWGWQGVIVCEGDVAFLNGSKVVVFLWEDTNCDGEAVVDHHEESPNVEQELVHVIGLHLHLFHKVPTAVEAHQQRADAAGVSDGVDHLKKGFGRQEICQELTTFSMNSSPLPSSSEVL